MSRASKRKGRAERGVKFPIEMEENLRDYGEFNSYQSFSYDEEHLE